MDWGMGASMGCLGFTRAGSRSLMSSCTLCCVCRQAHILQGDVTLGHAHGWQGEAIVDTYEHQRISATKSTTRASSMRLSSPEMQAAHYGAAKCLTFVTSAAVGYGR